MLKWILACTLLLTSTSYAIDADEMPYGIYFHYKAASVGESTIDSMVNLLGFNVGYPLNTSGISQERIEWLDSLGMISIPYMTEPGNDQLNSNFWDYLRSHYALIQAEDDTSDIRFMTKSGNPDGEWFSAPDSDTVFIMLDDLWYRLESKSAISHQLVNYEPFLLIRIDADSITTGETVAVFNVWASRSNWWAGPEYRHGGVIYNETILSDGFQPHTPKVVNLPDFQFMGYFIDTITVDPLETDTIPSSILTYQLVSYGDYPVSVDWFKVYDIYGKRLIEDGLYDSSFVDHVNQSWTDSTILYWLLRDEPKYDMAVGARHMDSLIVVNSGKRGLTNFHYGGLLKPKAFLDIAQPKVISADIYPFFGGSSYDDCSSSWETLYYSDIWDTTNKKMGLQRAMDRYVVGDIDSIKQHMADTVEFWLVSQAMACKRTDCGESSYIKRRPTGPEMSCEAFIGLCHGIKGIIFWVYGWRAAYSGDYLYYYGLIDSTNTITDIWSSIENHVTPNLKALDEYLVDSTIVWDRAYRACNYLGHNPPPSAYLTGTLGWSDSYNPDSGWVHVGEFHDNSAKYILLVNRACSKDDNGTPAPRQYFTVKMNPSTIGSNYVYIIDLADSVYYDSTESDWVGIPDTTYSAKMSDGTIPFTTVLDPGEGRLFKIVGTVQQ